MGNLSKYLYIYLLQVSILHAQYAHQNDAQTDELRANCLAFIFNSKRKTWKFILQHRFVYNHKVHFSRYSKCLICSSKALAAGETNVFIFICIFEMFPFSKNLENILKQCSFHTGVMFPYLYCFATVLNGKSLEPNAPCVALSFCYQHSPVFKQLFHGAAARAPDRVQYLSMQDT